MKKIIFTSALLIATLFSSKESKAQMAAMDFTMTDCNGGGPHNLFTDLNSGKAVIIEYFMLSCSPCVVAGNAMEAMRTNLQQQYPGKVKAYAFAFNNTYSCSAINNWITTNAFTSIPSDSGATQVAYYGGMGMPTVIVAGGTNHQLLRAPYLGFNVSDTTTLAASIRSFLNSQTQGVKENKNLIHTLSIQPNPANNEVELFLDENFGRTIQVEIMDITGRVLLSSANTTLNEKNMTLIDCSSLPSGSYFIHVSNGESSVNKKLLIIH